MLSEKAIISARAYKWKQHNVKSIAVTRNHENRLIRGIHWQGSIKYFEIIMHQFLNLIISFMWKIYLDDKILYKP